MPKLFVCDMDGTLLTDQKQLLPKSKDVLIERQKQGDLLVLASGRVKTRMLSYAQELKMDVYGGYLIEANGSVIYDIKKDKRSIIRSMSYEEAEEIPDIDFKIENTVMCVLLRGALLPSMIMSKEIEEYSSHGYVTPFALFKIKRDDSKKESNMEYVLDLDKSYFNIEDLQDKDLIFADPMNATGGSLVTVIKYLLNNGVKPRSIKVFNVISALKGSLRVVRALENCTCYTLWMDPVLNAKAYIMPGLGDAGDRLNGCDTEDAPRNILQLIADYGSNVADLYRSQLRKIEHTVLGK